MLFRSAVSKLIAGEYNVEISELDNVKIAVPSKKASVLDFLFLIFIIIIIKIRFFWFFPTPGRSRGYWSGGNSSGGFGGGFGGFGGGFSGGGGASGRW